VNVSDLLASAGRLLSRVELPSYFVGSWDWNHWSHLKELLVLHWPQFRLAARVFAVLSLLGFAWFFPWSVAHYVLTSRKLLIIHARCCSSLDCPAFEAYAMNDLTRYSGGPSCCCCSPHTISLVFRSADSTSFTTGMQATGQTPGAFLLPGATVGGLVASTSNKRNAITLRLWDTGAYRSCLKMLASVNLSER